MIARATLAFGLMWLLVPYHPHLGLTVPVVQPGDDEREAIFSRLREVRREIEPPKAGYRNLVWDEGGGAAPYKAGRLPDKVSPASVLAQMLHSVAGQLR